MAIRQEEMGLLIRTIHKYINEYNGRQFINYYDLFGIDKSLSPEQIQDYMTKMRFRVLFHPDFIYNVPEHLRSVYPEVCECYKSFYQIVITPYKKKEYDQKLIKEEKEKQKAKYTYYEDRTISFDEENEEDELEKEKERLFLIFGKYLLPTCAKYGTKNCAEAIRKYITNGYLNGFTRNQGTRDKITSISRNIVLECMFKAYPGLDSIQIANCVVEDTERFANSFVSEATLETYQKYNANQAKYALAKLIKEGSIQGFTNRKTREKLRDIELSSPTLMFIMAKEMGLDVAYGVHIGDISYLVDEYFKGIEELRNSHSYGYK